MAAGAARRALQLDQHQVLLLQQLQPGNAALILQDLPPLLDRGRLAPERPLAAPTSGTVPVGLDAKNPRLMHEGARDLKLVLPHHGGRDLLQPPEFAAFPSLETSGATVAAGNGAASSGVGVLSAMDLLRRAGCYVPLQDVQLGIPAEYAAAGFGLGEFRFRMPAPPPVTHGTRGVQESAGSSLLFPFEDLTLAASAAGDASAGADQGDGGGEASGVVTAGHDTTGFWSNSMTGNGRGNGGASPW
ncbi:hypothetical protein C2845_PM17G03580 [Panicum miliaceum]|uniref:Uncharacterized protein n=1 Tax=Panicum miliaceum TaxID=4540 RepID=A0A3L6Q1Z1_PANMI|nr:hypothetical protein C2845_PM17G03580 [Panicum miliaceum]